MIYMVAGTFYLQIFLMTPNGPDGPNLEKNDPLIREGEDTKSFLKMSHSQLEMVSRHLEIDSRYMSNMKTHSIGG